LGCDEPIDYRQGPVAEQAAGVDVVIDSLGGDAGIRSLDCLKPGGTLVTLPSVTATQVIEAAQTRGLNASGIRVQSNPEQLRQLIDLMVMDQLQLRIDRVFSLQDVGSAHLYSQTGHASGKIILEM
jgi:NADPH:quinone reductase-like Zn-dependent oxidoreductase